MRRVGKHRAPLRKLVLFACALSVLYLGYYWGGRHALQRAPQLSLTALRSPELIRIPPQLHDQYDQPFTDQRLRGRWTLMFFGYSRSRESSPALLTLATQINNRLADKQDLQNKLQVVLITVDPEYDRAEILNRYLAFYSPDFLALTGSIDAARLLGDQLGLRFHRRTEAEDASVRIDHSTSIALIDPSGRILGLFTGLVDAVKIARDLKQLASQHP